MYVCNICMQLRTQVNQTTSRMGSRQNSLKCEFGTLQRLPKEILEKPEFESYFVGAESKIDQVLSSTWLKAHTKHWTWKNFIMANTPRYPPSSFFLDSCS